MADEVSEEVGLLREAGGFARRDEFAQLDDGITDGRDEDGVVAEFLVQSFDLRFKGRAP